MSMTKAHIKASAKYNSKAYEQIIFRVKKGEKATIQAIATEQGMSVNGFITAALEHYIKTLKSPLTDISISTEEPNGE